MIEKIKMVYMEIIKMFIIIKMKIIKMIITIELINMVCLKKSNCLYVTGVNLIDKQTFTTFVIIH